MSKLNVLPGMEAFAEGLDAPKIKNKVSGYAAPPGTGPKGETCKSCKHICRHHDYKHTYIKCGVIRHRWTHGLGTDIRVKSPACRLWEKPAPTQQPVPT